MAIQRFERAVERRSDIQRRMAPAANAAKWAALSPGMNRKASSSWGPCSDDRKMMRPVQAAKADQTLKVRKDSRVDFKRLK